MVLEGRIEEKDRIDLCLRTAQMGSILMPFRGLSVGKLSKAGKLYKPSLPPWEISQERKKSYFYDTGYCNTPPKSVGDAMKLKIGRGNEGETWG